MPEPSSLVREFAHELRNAISPIRSAAELLRLKGADRETLPKILAIVDRGLDSALQTIDCFVNADRAASGSLALNPVPTELHRIIDAAMARAKAQIESHQQKVEMSSDTAERVDVLCDPEPTAQAVTALLEHASRTIGHGATLSLSTRSEPETAQVGVRFPAAEGAAVDPWFESYRASGTGSRMALRTARRVIELQHGSLVATSRSGTIELVLALPRSHAVRVPPEPRESASSDPAKATVGRGAVTDAAEKIMIVDDSEAIRTAYREALEELGYEVVLAASGEEALELADEAAPDVALIDIHLPKQNGYQVAQAIRARRAAKTMRLVMLSGMTLDDTTRRLSQKAGFDDCIDKGAGPLALDALLKRARSA